MIGEKLEGCLNKGACWAMGVLFGGAGVWAIIGASSADKPVVVAALAVLLLFTAAMLIIGFGFGRGKKFFALTWVLLMIVFFVIAAIAGSR